jgi:flagellar biosynthetic protein FliP
MKRLVAAAAALLGPLSSAAAQTVDLNTLIPAGGASASGRIIEMVALLTVLSVAPGLLIMVTSFTRFIIALSFLRSGLGVQSAPANLVLISLALFMTFFVMAPTFDRAWQNGLKPMLDNKISQQDALAAVAEPFREFMSPRQGREYTAQSKACAQTLGHRCTGSHIGPLKRMAARWRVARGRKKACNPRRAC